MRDATISWSSRYSARIPNGGQRIEEGELLQSSVRLFVIFSVAVSECVKGEIVQACFQNLAVCIWEEFMG